MFRHAAKRLVPAISTSFRGFASEAGAAKQSGGSGGLLLGLAGAGAGLYVAREQGYLDTLLGAPSSKVPTADDYAKVKAAIAAVLDNDDHDDGSYGPILVRLAWHTSGTYDKATGTGGSNGATMRFNPESGWGANAGLKTARDVLEPIKRSFPWISYADLWTLAGAVAIEEMGGPEIPWRPGRSDKDERTHVPLPDGRLPDGDKGADHVRDIFYRMGFNDQEIVALVGAHALGRCHPSSSGWDGPWTNAPTTFSNEYFVQLADNKWSKKKWSGPEQYEDPTGSLMMLPADMCLLWDRKFKKHVMEYKADEDKFRADFARAFSKLMELGVPFGNAA